MSTLLKSELDWQSREVGARRKGLAEGRMEGLKEGFTKGHDEGRNEASLDIAQKMKTMGFLAEQIQAVTGLPIETVEQI
jgi:predicted transposase/invertase (TIGR01784 family)